MKPMNRIILALDVSSEKEALELAASLKEHVALFKVGLELLNSFGIGIVKKIVDIGGDVFLDGKLMDIPNTVGRASQALTKLGINMFNVHSLGGLEMMKAAVTQSKNAATEMGIKRPLVLGVTMLTSIEKDTMNHEMRIPGEVEDQVVHLAKLAEGAGLDGVIASPLEIRAIKDNISREMLIVTPGVRPEWAQAQDQKRIMTPAQAISSGASYIVIGRPITQPPDCIGAPIEAVRLIEEEIDSILQRGK